MNGQFTKGQIPWNKDKKRPEMSGELHPFYSKKHTEKSKQKIRDTIKKNYPNGRKVWNKNMPMPEATKKKVSDSKKGKPSNSPTKFKKGQISLRKGKLSPETSGNKNGNWKGGVMPLHAKIRGSIEYHLWEESVFSKGNFKCQKCGHNQISKLVAHHILNFAQWPELRFAIDNGILLCFVCHNLFHKIYGKKNNNQEQIDKFIAS
mgnify:CR=1 FL=1